MHDFLGYLFYLLQRSLSLLLPAVVLAMAVLGIFWLIYRKNGRPFPWKKALLSLVLLAWLSDTKGFYQPVYRFKLRQDGGNITLDYVTALK